jgi:hypothetical protein
MAHDLFDTYIFKGKPFFIHFTLHVLLPRHHFFFLASTASLFLPLLCTSTASFFSFVDVSEASDDKEVHQARNGHRLVDSAC